MSPVVDTALITLLAIAAFNVVEIVERIRACRAVPPTYRREEEQDFGQKQSRKGVLAGTSMHRAIPIVPHLISHYCTVLRLIIVIPFATMSSSPFWGGA